jgi:hypothetical protein
MHCINACEPAPPLAQILISPDSELEHLHTNHSTVYFDPFAHSITQSFTMAISQHDKMTRVTKRAIAPKRRWTEAIKEKIVQSALYAQFAWGSSTNKPKSQHNASLQEALECTKCKQLEITPYMMKTDIAMGLYTATKYPPYFSNKAAPVEEICPLDTKSPQHEAATFWKDITFSQQQCYYEQVDAIIKRTELESGHPATEATVLFAHYQMDSHIRQHYLAPKSMLNLCRDKQDVMELRHWQWENAESEGFALESDPHFGVGWVSDPTNSLALQYEGWKMNEGRRESHLLDTKARWAEIQTERRKQRMQSVVVSLKGMPVRVYKYEPSEPPMSEEEIQEMARRNAAKTEFNEPLVKPL